MAYTQVCTVLSHTYSGVVGLMKYTDEQIDKILGIDKVEDEVTKQIPVIINEAILDEYTKADTLNYQPLWKLDKILVDIQNLGFICGGCFKNLFEHKAPKDYDIFFSSKDKFNYAVKMLNKSDKYTAGYHNDKVISFINKEEGYRLELNHSEWGKPLEVIDTFDFTITQFAYYWHSDINGEDSDNDGYNVVFNKNFFEHLYMKRLVVHSLPYPVSSFNRSYRYAKYGYQLCRESKVKLIQALQSSSLVEDEDLDGGLYDGKD